MKIVSHQLLAFFQTAKLRHFTKAANQLGITQSALSQRITNLESELEVTLFIRDPAGLILTEAGETLLRYCQVSSSLEQEVLSKLKSSISEVGGMIRIGAFSSVLRSIIIPTLAPLLRQKPNIHCEFASYEVSELYEVLKNAKAEFVVTDHELNHKGLVGYILGQEEYVVIESTKFMPGPHVYLDHDPRDTATHLFFSQQPNAPEAYRRNFMGDVYGIINGVELGLGRAVMSRHLLKNNSQVKLVKGYKKFTKTVWLYHFEQPYYSRLHTDIVAYILKNAPEKFKNTISN